MKPIHISFGIIAFIGMIILANIVVYDTLIQLFTFSFSPILIELFLWTLSLSFIAAIIIGRNHSSIVSRIFFIITSIWCGLFVYIFLASIIYLIIFEFTGKEHIILGEILISTLTLVGIYGIFNAKIISTKKHTIKLQNLPKEWVGRKIIWVSDIHLGLVYGKKHMERIVKKINEICPDIVFIGGDLFDVISTPSVLHESDPLKNLKARLGVFFVSGNHEHYGNYDIFMEKISSMGIKILKNEIIIIDGVQVIGIEYQKKMREHYYRKLLSNLEIKDEIPSILLRHEPRDLKITEQAGVNFQISGHTHNAQQWPLNYYAKIIYKKFTYGLQKQGKMQVYTSSGAGTWGPAIRVGSNNEIVEFTFL